MIQWKLMPTWKIVAAETAFYIKIAPTIEDTFPVTVFRSDIVSLDVHYTQRERQIGYVFRLKQVQSVEKTLWYVWIHGEEERPIMPILKYQDYNVRLLQFTPNCYLLVMRWQVKEGD